MADREFLSRLNDAFAQTENQQYRQGVGVLKRANGNGGGRDGDLRKLLMLLQMQESMGVSDAVPRTQEIPVNGGPKQFQWAPPASHALPELPTTYQPANRWNYGKPVRIG